MDVLWRISWKSFATTSERISPVFVLWFLDDYSNSGKLPSNGSSRAVVSNGHVPLFGRNWLNELWTLIEFTSFRTTRYQWINLMA